MTFCSAHEAKSRPWTRTPSAAHQRHAATVAEVVTVLTIGVVLVIVFLVMLPQMQRRPISMRTLCASNLKGVGTGLYTYANENSDMFPIVPHAPAEEDGLGRVSYAPKKIGVKRTGIMAVASAPAGDDSIAGGSTIEDTELSTTRNLWVLVRNGSNSPKFFYCPEAPDDMPNDEDDPQTFYDFARYTEVSYGYQVPYGRKGQPSVESDQRMPVVADKGPYGAALDAGKPHPGTPNLAVGASPDDWIRWNSPNHGGQGQIVLYADTHAEFQAKPTCGVNNDNIYTRWQGAEGEIKTNDSARAHGVPPTGRETPWSNTDTLIYP